MWILRATLDLLCVSVCGGESEWEYASCASEYMRDDLKGLVEPISICNILESLCANNDKRVECTLARNVTNIVVVKGISSYLQMRYTVYICTIEYCTFHTIHSTKWHTIYLRIRTAHFLQTLTSHAYGVH